MNSDNALKTIIKSYTPPSMLTLVRNIRYRNKPIKWVFTKLYYEPHRHRELVSGLGSDLKQTVVIASEIPKLIKEIGAKSLLDAPCGDFSWMRNVDLGLDKYTGVDIVSEQIERNERKYTNKIRKFICLDITTDELPRADLILCRDLFVHFSFRDILAALANFQRTKSEYLLTTSFTQTTKNIDIITGGWRPINLQLPPFNFPRPLRLINEHCTENEGKYTDKSLALWRLDDLYDYAQK